jgi:hypothetical protein
MARRTEIKMNVIGMTSTPIRNQQTPKTVVVTTYLIAIVGGTASS